MAAFSVSHVVLVYLSGLVYWQTLRRFFVSFAAFELPLLLKNRSLRQLILKKQLLLFLLPLLGGFSSSSNALVELLLFRMIIGCKF